MKKTVTKTSAKKMASTPKSSAGKVPAMTRKSPFAVIQTVKDVYKSVFLSPVDYLKMWIVGAVILVGATVLTHMLFVSSVTGNQMPPICSVMGFYFLAVIGGILIHANFVRKALLKETSVIQKDKLFLRYFLKSLFLMLAFVGIGTTVGFFTGGIGSFAAFHLYEAGIVPLAHIAHVRMGLVIGLGTIFGLVTLFALFRTLMFLPAAYMKKSVSMHQSFSLTKGATLRLFAFFCLIYLPAIVLSIISLKLETIYTSPIHAGLTALILSIFTPVSGAAYAAVYKFFASGASLDEKGKAYAKIPFTKTLANSYMKVAKAPVSYLKASVVMVALIVAAFCLLRYIPAGVFMLVTAFVLIGITTLFVRTATTKKDSLFLLDKTSWMYALRHLGGIMLSFILSLSNVFTVCIVLLMVVLSVAFEPAIRAFVIYSSYPQLFMTIYPNAPLFIGLFSLFLSLLMAVGFIFCFIRYGASLASRFLGQKISFADSHGLTKGNAVRLTGLGILTILPFIVCSILANVLLTNGLPFAGFVAVRALSFVLLAPFGVLIAEVYAFVRNKAK